MVGRSKRTVLIGATVGFAFACGRASNGAASYDELARKAFAATSRGDADTLMGLADPAALTKLTLDCDNTETRVREQTENTLARAKSAIKDLDGLALDVREVRIDRETRTFEPGTSTPDGHCKYKVSGKFVSVVVLFSATGKTGNKYDDKNWIDAIEVGGRWYLAEPLQFGAIARKERMNATPSPDCAHALGNSHVLQQAKYAKLPPQAQNTILEILVQHCVADGWEPDARRCLDEAKSADDAATCINTKLMPQHRVNTDEAIDAALAKLSP